MYTLTLQNPTAAQNALAALQATPRVADATLIEQNGQYLLQWQKTPAEANQPTNQPTTVAPTTVAITFNDDYNTLTLSLTNDRPRKCGCGVRMAPGEAVALTSMESYRNRRAIRLCLPCALNIIHDLAYPLRKLNKPYPHFVESLTGPISQAEAAATFEAVYRQLHPTTP
jgi:hypothetical protein